MKKRSESEWYLLGWAMWFSGALVNRNDILNANAALAALLVLCTIAAVLEWRRMR